MILYNCLLPITYTKGLTKTTHCLSGVFWFRSKAPLSFSTSFQPCLWKCSLLYPHSLPSPLPTSTDFICPQSSHYGVKSNWLQRVMRSPLSANWVESAMLLKKDRECYNNQGEKEHWSGRSRRGAMTPSKREYLHAGKISIPPPLLTSSLFLA